MKKSTLTALAGGALALSLLAAGGAWASGARANDDDRPDSAAIAQARISLADAAQAAERHAGGRAYEAGIEEEHGALFYDLEVAGDSAVAFSQATRFSLRDSFLGDEQAIRRWEHMVMSLPKRTRCRFRGFASQRRAS